MDRTRHPRAWRARPSRTLVRHCLTTLPGEGGVETASCADTPQLEADSERDAAPDYVDPTIGWRVWDVVADGSELRLASVGFRTIWEPRERETAVCRSSVANRAWLRLGAHDAPHPRCSCGVYAVRDPWHAAAYFARPFMWRWAEVHRVLGTVSLWGRVVEGSQGWRASYAYPAHIVVPATRRSVFSLVTGFPQPSRPPDEIAAALGCYGVPVETVPCSTSSGLVTDLLVRERRLVERAA